MLIGVERNSVLLPALPDRYCHVCSGYTRGFTSKTHPMSKPIFVVQLPTSSDPDLRMKISKHLEGKMPDYHVLCIESGAFMKPEFQLFSGEKVEPIEIEALKEIVNNTL
jgi:hypothetical protein